MKAFPKDVTVRTMKVRHIGVENELGVEGTNSWGQINRGDIPSKVRKVMDAHGLLQSIGLDGGGREFRTNPISVKSLYQVKGHKYLREYYDTLKQHSRVIDTGGTHIHISILNSDHKNMESNATAVAIAFFPQFQKICGRRSSWAYRWSTTTLDSVRDGLATRRYNGNSRTYRRMGTMLNPTAYQTLELRGGVGTNDADTILAWIEFLQNVVKASNRETVHGLRFGDLLKGERIEKYVDSLPRSKRFTKKELNKTLDKDNLWK